ncbi:GntR family transcriptional regulator [Sulfitobacter sp. SK011]|uniref:GntR family transcriptional regulator n=1 Tax=Sulfitobacter sp. SK011 TaxID=1389004 RepID=UPI000E0B3385|nr:GntR family transcriptional regulator [Sulfitobacter sp. SK011]AXI43986.1 GntR family transcriptional regulator [Sulfitobacter sp. SK011]
MTAFDSRPIRKTSLHLEAAHALREAIIGGDLAPGDRLDEAEYCDAFRISRTPLREAFKLLEAENLLWVRPGRGVYVTVMTAHEVTDLFEVVSDLERLAVTLAVERMSITDRARLRRMHDRMLHLYRRDELRECFQADFEIHSFLVEKSASSVLRETHFTLMARARRGRYVALFSRARWDEAMIEHESFMEAIERRDAVSAGALVHRHVTRTGAVLRQTLIEEQSRTAI